MNKIKLTEKRCQCAACGEYFSTTANFDKHRVGEHGVNRRCLDADGMVKVGMKQTAIGLWVTNGPDGGLRTMRTGQTATI